MSNKLIFILLLQWFNQNFVAPENLENKIKELESEKRKLFKQINDAIDDSVVSLKKSNSTDSQLGISYIEDLKKQMKDLNEAESLDKVNENEGIIVDNKYELENRRMKGLGNIVNIGKNAPKSKTYNKDIAEALKSKSKLEFAYFESMKNKSKKWRQKYQARLNIQEKLDQWIEKREIEKQKIRESKQRKMIYKEKCPNFGKGKVEKGKKRGGKAKQGKTYPCCRKCCKTSYMGCLRKK